MAGNQSVSKKMEKLMGQDDWNSHGSTMLGLLQVLHWHLYPVKVLRSIYHTPKKIPA